MARSRNIKPGLFKNEILGEADPIYTLLFAGLWTLADKEGRLENRPKRIRAELFPYRFELDLSTALAWLKHESFITVYEFDDKSYIQINTWRKHQSPHHKETESEIPSIEESGKQLKKQELAQARLKHDSSTTHEQTKESASTPLIPDSLNLIPDSLPKEKYKKEKFKSPSRIEVLDYMISKGVSDPNEAEKFVCFYESKNWMVGKNKMTNWHGSVGGWLSRNKSNSDDRKQEPGRRVSKAL